MTAAAGVAQSKPTFEVVDLKAWKAGEHPSRYRNDVQRQDPGRVVGQYAPLSSLLRYAFHLTVSATIEGLPTWAGANVRGFQRATMFYVDARMPAATTDEQSRLMTQTLLQEQFKLAWHWKKEPTKVLELTSTASDLKLQPPDPANDKMPAKATIVSCPRDVNGCAIYSPRTETMEEMAASFPKLIFGMPVVDKTG
ncbi:MAG TPA: TIGR03435 family protein, partial [Terriglobales bacterium]|nr:TIGR03435 family protein [Terriglobales bacterium]